MNKLWISLLSFTLSLPLVTACGVHEEGDIAYNYAIGGASYFIGAIILLLAISVIVLSLMLYKNTNERRGKK